MKGHKFMHLHGPKFWSSNGIVVYLKNNHIMMQFAVCVLLSVCVSTIIESRGCSNWPQYKYAGIDGSLLGNFQSLALWPPWVWHFKMLFVASVLKMLRGRASIIWGCREIFEMNFAFKEPLMNFCLAFFFAILLLIWHWLSEKQNFSNKQTKISEGLPSFPF